MSGAPAHKKTAGKARLLYDGREYELDVLEGTYGDRAVDIGKLRRDAGLITFDPGFANTGSCRSDITFIDGEKGVLRHRGYAIEDLVEHCTFVEVAYLLVHGRLPSADELEHYARLLNRHSMIHEGMRTFFRNFPERAHPMAVLAAMAVSLSAFYPEMERDEEGPQGEEALDMAVTRLLSKLRTIAAISYKRSIGEPVVYPSHKLKYCANFLNMMFSSPVRDYTPDPLLCRALDQLFIMHADHGQNCSTAAVRLTGSSDANLYASVSAGICALWGPRHGGANEQVLNMLRSIHRDGMKIETVIETAKQRDASFRLMGFGHRVYKTYDPRARLAKQICHEVLQKMGVDDPLLDIAMHLEEAALRDSYFQERNLYPNVDFYTGILFRAMGIPDEMFTVMFAIGRLPGWIANWLEWKADEANRIGRPRDLYVGPETRKFVPLNERG